jgi:hypothetical protein
MDGAVGERDGERLVHAAVLVEEREAVELRADDRHLEVVASAGAVLDVDRGCGRKRLHEERSNRVGIHSAMLDARRYAAEVRLIRAVLLFKVGFLAGMVASALLLQRVFPSRGGEESDEVALVAILNGIALKSRATAFRGGSMFSWLGGIAVDLREAQLAPDAHLDLRSVFGGIAIRVPPGWRVESNVSALGGGVAIGVPDPESDDAPTLRLNGFSALGGIAVGAKPQD